MKRSIGSIVLALLLVVLLVPTGALAAPQPTSAPTTDPAAPVAPKVVLIVGPVGGTTSTYRRLAERAAKVAERYTSNVVRLYSPNATWPAVREALEGASIVVYLGHGNGWPSRYRDSPYPATQNGFGLNPVAGGGDGAHQYFGESHVDDVKLAKNAVVLLHHLCYASGNTEPGLPEGTLDQAVQRVDNYAAGFIRAGAAAVVAEGHMGPAWYVEQLLATDRSIERIWRSSPERHGNAMAFDSVRSAGFNTILDPDRKTGGYYRSLVTTGTVSAGEVRGGAVAAVRDAVDAPTVSGPPTLADLDLEVSAGRIKGRPIAGEEGLVVFRLPAAHAKQVPAGLQVGVRWDPIELDVVAPDPATEVPPAAEGGSETTVAEGEPAAPVADPSPGAAPATEPASEPGPDVSPAAEPADPGAEVATSPGRRPAGTGTVDAGPAADEPLGAPAEPAEPEPAAEAPGIALVVPEQHGSVVAPAPATIWSKGVNVPVTFPDAPGLYRLVLTLHDADGIAYDLASQSLIGGLQVRVAGPRGVAYGVAPSLETEAGSSLALPVRLRNTGTIDWVADLDTVPAGEGPDADRVVTRTAPARLVATWVSIDGRPVPEAVRQIVRDGDARAGAEGVVELALTAPAQTGSYLLVLDVLTGADGALSAHGNEPAIVRVTVTAGS